MNDFKDEINGKSDRDLGNNDTLVIMKVGEFTTKCIRKNHFGRIYLKLFC